jgi:hypothetical protein
MMDNEERRSPAAGRVPVETLVEICGNDPGIPAFEAESLDVSGRGMHVRTAYLPEEGAPLVCRFEDRGREIVVEGVVAWRTEEARGGEFGIQFTALDSGSVDALRELCGTGSAGSDPHDDEGSPDEPDAGASAAEPGARVRLHIDGLGSPMKARVRDGGSRKVSVGSNLEFLKVGRHLEIEDLHAGDKRGAHIDSVDVVVDPATQVPQLVVSLRFDDAESTPEPSVIDTGMSATHRSPLPPPHMPAGIEQGRAESDAFDDDFAEAELAPEDEVAAEAGALRERFDSIAGTAGEVARTTGATLARAGGVAAQGLGRLFKGAGAKVVELKQKRSGQDEAAPRRTTAVPPSGVLSSRGVRLRPQSSSRDAVPATQPAPVPPPAKKSRAKKVAIAASAVVLLATVIALATHKSAPPPGAKAQAAASPAVPANVDVKQVDEQGNPVVAQRASGKPLSTKKELAEPGKKGVTADVPLFGPKPMATMEPAPLGSAPEEGANPLSLDAEGARELAAAKAAPAAADETFNDKPAKKARVKKQIRPQDVGPWGHGHVHKPTIHRLRLDAAGSAIQGAINPTGFTVVIPGRKVMESGRSIARRDKRIARVSTSNTAGGAQISFKFRDGVPGYRVRLRHDFVEFLISAPHKSAPSSTKTSHHKHHHSSKKSSTAHATSTHHSKKSAKHHNHKKHD